MNAVLAQLGVGGAVIVAVFWLVLKYKPWETAKHSNGNAVMEARVRALEREVQETLRPRQHVHSNHIQRLLTEVELLKQHMPRR